MQIVVTKEGGKLLNEDLETRSRQNELLVVENESGTVQINLTSDEADDFERITDLQIDSDVMSDAVVAELVSFVEREGLLEKTK
jgi:hypothetical protein